jgi:hypothetical protein
MHPDNILTRQSNDSMEISLIINRYTRTKDHEARESYLECLEDYIDYYSDFEVVCKTLKKSLDSAKNIVDRQRSR